MHPEPRRSIVDGMIADKGDTPMQNRLSTNLASANSVLKKCFASGSEGFRSHGRQQNVSESGDSLELCERTVGAKAPLQDQMTFSTGC